MTSGEDPSGLVLERGLMLRVVGLVAGAIILLFSVPFADGPDAWPFYLIGFVAAAYAMIGQNGRSLIAFMHWGAAIALLMVGMEWCSSKCGGLTYYEYRFGVSAAWIGVALHVFTGLALVGKSTDKHIGRFASNVCIGASIFYIAVLIGHRSWCSGCVAAHCFTFLALLGWLWNSEGKRVWLMVVEGVAAAGVLNAVHHYRAFPVIQNDPQELMVYMRDLWMSEPQPAVIAQREGGGDRNLSDRNGQAVKVDDLDLMPPFIDESKSFVEKGDGESDADGKRTPVKPETVSALDERRPLGVLGSAEAPVVFKMILDFACEGCRQQYVELNALMDLVAEKKVSFEFYFISEHGTTLRRQASQAMSNLAYAASAQSQRQFIKALDVFFNANYKTMDGAEDVVNYASGKLAPYEMLADWMDIYGKEVSRAIQVAGTLRVARGGGGTPKSWIHKKGVNEPLREFSGFTSSRVLRLALSTVIEESQ